MNKTENEGMAPDFPENGETVKEEKFMEPLDMELNQQKNLKKRLEEVLLMKQCGRVCPSHSCNTFRTSLNALKRP